MPLEINTLYEGEVNVQDVVFSHSGEKFKKERVVRQPKVVAICHDDINGQVLVLNQYRHGAMMQMDCFPEGPVAFNEMPSEAVKRVVKAASGITVKTVEFVEERMDNPSSDSSPVKVFYCTFDSRILEDGTEIRPDTIDAATIRLVNSKALIGEVAIGQHMNPEVIHGARYLKLKNHNLER